MATDRWCWLRRRLVGALFLLCLLAGCGAPGRIYTDWTTPLTNDFTATPRGTRSCELDEHHLEEPVTRAGISVDWTSEVIRRAMAEAGMTRAYTADRRVISILGGIY